MTEGEWLAREEAGPLFRDPGWSPGDRKVRLFCLACCERIRGLILDPRSRAAIEFLERNTDVPHSRRKGIAEVRAAAKKAHDDAYMAMYQATEPIEHAKKLALSNAANAAYDTLHKNPRRAAEDTAAFAVHAIAWDWLVANHPEQLPNYPREVGNSERLYQVLLLSDIFGNPFHPVFFDRAWRSDTAVSLAKHIYESREFSAMPILSDALQDAGCDNADVLNHCRDEKATHVRGCWVVDLVLGKE
jgi:hypothetical protein